MNGLVLCDGGRASVTWTSGELRAGRLAGAILTPFHTPVAPEGGGGGRTREHAEYCVTAYRGCGADVMFDAMTHVATLPGVSLFARYDRYDLWPGGNRGDLTTATRRDRHVERVLEVQAGLGLPSLAPTVSLDSPVGSRVTSARAMARRARQLDNQTWFSVFGTSAFWEGGHQLDSFVGSLAQERPAGWLIGVMRPRLSYPAPGITAEEIEGLARTTHSLSRRAPVIVSHGDFAALPAVAAGAIGLGTGWDLRQRVLTASAFAPVTETRRASFRVSAQGLIGALRRANAEALAASDRRLAQRLLPGSVPQDLVAAFRHHFSVLRSIQTDIDGRARGRVRSHRLRTLYTDATRNWARVAAISRPQTGEGESGWVTSVADGVDRYIAAEGW